MVKVPERRRADEPECSEFEAERSRVPLLPVKALEWMYVEPKNDPQLLVTEPFRLRIIGSKRRTATRSKKTISWLRDYPPNAL